MEIEGFTKAISTILEVETPWTLTKINVQRKNKVVDVFIEFLPKSKFECPQCNAKCSVYDSSTKRIRHLDLFDYRCYLNIKTPRIKCEEHGVKAIGSTRMFRKGSHYSYLLEDKIMRLCTQMSMSAISKEIGEPDNNLWRVFKHYTSVGIEDSIDLSTTTRIGVDETANKRGHDYVTIFTDMDSGDVILVEEGRKKEVFQKLYGWLFDKGGHPKSIELFSMDMSKSYKAGRYDYFANSQEVYDRFHIKKALNVAVDMVRREEVKYCEDLKKTKYLWLKGDKKLKVKEREKLAEFIAEGTYKTAIAYQMKTAFDQLWKVQKQATKPFLEEWIESALQTGLEPLATFVKTLWNNYEGIMLSFQTGITNALSEGINSVVQLAKSRARGFRNMDNFKAMIYFLGNKEIYTTHEK